MRLYEFTNAEEQLKLLQLIFDTTFSTIRQQAEQQAREKAEQSRLAKLKPKRKSSIKSKSLPSIKVSAPPKPPTKPSTPTTNPNQPLAKSSQPPSNLSSHPTQPPTNSPTTLPNKTVAPTALPHIKPIRSTAKPMPSLHPSHTQAMPQNALNVPKDGYLDKNIDAVQNDVRGTDRHSKNGIATLKKTA